MRTLSVAFLLVVSLVGRTHAQGTEVRPGVRLRITAPGVVADRMVGTLLSRSADTLVIGGPDIAPLSIPLNRVTALEISRGNSRSQGALRGVKWGVPIMLVLGTTFLGEPVI